MNTSQTRARSGRQDGSISVEFALMLVFFFMPMLIGIIDFGQILHAQSVVARAAREGVLAAARNQDIPTAVDGYMQNAGYDTSLAHIATAGSRVAGEPVMVTVRYDTSAMVIIPWQGISPNMTQVVATATAQQF
ncbi:MAG: TadE-like protein [Solidesulfovibrio magneticus str. Maddingley MBC34]|uniref:TadE-like protein n=1 Tax=Solidesulfovibrio magneticus str. Maddingley MBC34 TaxID=1206767 RepID=K6GB11_9BACT|nr:MAG: TadE-like protein [Solidesulfovibrio magneticus str. Maddingley MBC34]